jgi:hypothetical protein
VKPVLAAAIQIALEHVIEPLAQFLCAAEPPQAALASALAMLAKAAEVADRAASTPFGIVMENLWS